MSVEDLKRRNEVSMARKAKLTTGSAITNGTDTPPSPSGTQTGAMDSLLAKLRAAAPEARDQRDRRRRARLKDRHAVRVASGQNIPELQLTDQENVENGMLSPTSEADGSDTGASSAGLLSPTLLHGDGEGVVEGENADVASRAASMLQGLRSGDVSEMPEDVLRVRRRRESADEERARRRRRRQQGASDQSMASSVGAAGLMSPTAIPEEGEGDDTVIADDDTDTGKPLPDDARKFDEGLSPPPPPQYGGAMPLTPVTIVSPPSPAGSARSTQHDDGQNVNGLGLSDSP